MISSPVEHIRIRLQLQSGVKPAAPAAAAAAAVGGGPSGTRGMCTAAADAAYTGSVDAFKRIYGQHGLRGLYQGAGATFLREGIGYGAFHAPAATLHCNNYIVCLQLDTLRATKRPSGTSQQVWGARATWASTTTSWPAALPASACGSQHTPWTSSSQKCRLMCCQAPGATRR